MPFRYESKASIGRALCENKQRIRAQKAHRFTGHERGDYSDRSRLPGQNRSELWLLECNGVTCLELSMEAGHAIVPQLIVTRW